MSFPLFLEVVPGHHAQLDRRDGDENREKIPAPYVAEEPAILEERPGDDRSRDPRHAGGTPPVFEKPFVHELGEETHLRSSRRKRSSVGQRKTRANASASSKLVT